MDPQVHAAWIGLAGGVISTVMGAAVAAGITWRINQRKELEARLAECQGDVAYLLEVEKRLGELLKAMRGESFKNRVRAEVRRSGCRWSGNHTPGRLR